MTGLSLYSEPFAKTGNMAAEGFRRLLGRPTLGLMQTLLRESIQNVLDATQPGIGPAVLVRLRTLLPEQKSFLANSILAERPQGDATKDDISSALTKRHVRVLEICDFGTEGLSGPTRADAPHDGAEPLNFVNFLRNVGAARDTHQGGGTYGYGKSSLYAMSACSTIVVDSQTRNEGTNTRRFMACHLGAAFDAKAGRGRRRYTGRHWWGVLDGKDSIEPVTGSRAARMANKLGLPDRDPETTGTSILIVDPLLNSDNLSTVIDEVVETILWNFWPRMTGTTPRDRKLKVRLELEGVAIQVPRPEDFPPLDLFAEAMASQRAQRGSLREIRCGRPSKHLGLLAIQKGVRADRIGVGARDGSIIPKQISHIALMRPVELVVKYVAGDPFPDRRFEWAGVFICSDEEEVEAAFASAEPPAHDDWIPDNLPKGHEKTFVKVALREIEDIARTHGAPAAVVTGSLERGASLAATATTMGRFLGRVSSAGPGRPKRSSIRRPSARKSLSISPAKFARLVEQHGAPVAIFTAELKNDGSDNSLHVVAEPYLVLDGGQAGSEDLPDAFNLQVVGMNLLENRMSPKGPWMRAGSDAGQVEIRIPMPEGAAVGIRLCLCSGEPT